MKCILDTLARRAEIVGVLVAAGLIFPMVAVLKPSVDVRADWRHIVKRCREEW